METIVIKDKELIADLARKYANSCEFKSDHKYDWQSVFKGYKEGFETYIRLIEAKKADDENLINKLKQ